jgi:hypothetical protein
MSGSELIDLERARLALRSYGISVDRGRIVREAILVLLADLDARGEDSLLAGRLRDGALQTGIACTVGGQWLEHS